MPQDGWGGHTGKGVHMLGHKAFSVSAAATRITTVPVSQDLIWVGVSADPHLDGSSWPGGFLLPGQGPASSRFPGHVELPDGGHRVWFSSSLPPSNSV